VREVCGVGCFQEIFLRGRNKKRGGSPWLRLWHGIAGEAHYAHCNCCKDKLVSAVPWRRCPEHLLQGTLFVFYMMTFSIAHTPQGQIPAQMPQPMQYLSSETYS
jgi:hypothetical protein